MTYTIMGLAFGSVGVGVNNFSGAEWWVSLLIAIIPTIIGVVWDILRGIGITKGWFTEATAKKVDKKVNDVVEDLKDNGKLDNSNKK